MLCCNEMKIIFGAIIVKCTLCRPMWRTENDVNAADRLSEDSATITMVTDGMHQLSIRLVGGGPYGVRLSGGGDNEPLSVAKVSYTNRNLWFQTFKRNCYVLFQTVVTCKINLFLEIIFFEIISVFYFTCNHVWNWYKIISAAEIISKLFQRHWTRMQ